MRDFRVEKLAVPLCPGVTYQPMCEFENVRPRDQVKQECDRRQGDKAECRLSERRLKECWQGTVPPFLIPVAKHRPDCVRQDFD
jgi:hypothetical protein